MGKNKKHKNKVKLQIETQTKVENQMITESFESFEKNFTIRDFEEKKAFLLELQKSLESRQIEIERHEKQLSTKELEINAKFSSLEEDYAIKKHDALNLLNTEISNKRMESINKLNTEIDNERQLKLNNLNDEISKQKEELASTKEKFDREKRDFQNEYTEFNTKNHVLQLDRQAFEEEKNALDDSFKTKVEAAISEQRETFNMLLSSKDDELNSLRNNFGLKLKELENIKSTLIELGDDPSIILNKINQFKDENIELKNQLANLPTEELKAEYDLLKQQFNSQYSQLESMKELYEQKSSELESSGYYRFKYEDLNQKHIHQKSLFDEVSAHNQNLQARLARLTSSNGSNIDREALIKDISRPIIMFKSEDNIYIENGEQPIDEIQWLQSIEDKCNEYEIVLPRRILYAFHTALKISDWSQIAILSGVSGTGKSELPKLYSTFGGINFISVPVQTNWESQDDMLGFFNTLDNKFDAQPLLRFLIQSTTQLKDYMSIVLLDEMNLAHVEHYFSDFLSKLEERRAKKNRLLPSIEIKLAAGIEPYPLKLRRNVMWTGTMNQDETTKRLSDKVIDKV